jgi:hypothetical protein
MPLPTCSVSLPVSERPFSASLFSHQFGNFIRSIELDLWRLSGMGKPLFWLDTIPEAFASETDTEKSGH